MKKSRTNIYSDVGKFIMLSGTCWLIDLMLLLIMTRYGILPAFSANFISSLIAAMILYSIAHGQVHDGTSRKKMQKTAVYLLYTSIIIYGSSNLMTVILYRAHVIFHNVDYVFSTAFAKILITPPQLICNFFVSRVIAKFGSKMV